MDTAMARVTTAELRTELARCRLDVVLTDDMARMAMAVGQRYLGARKWREVRRVVREEAFSEFLVKLVKGWPRISDRNPFAYLTAMTRSATIDESRRAQASSWTARRASEDAARRTGAPFGAV